MKVQSIGPFQASTAEDLPDLHLETKKVRQNTMSTSEVKPDSATGDATQDQENRGFVHILDEMKRQQLKKRKAKSRSKEAIFSKTASKKRLVEKYLSLDETEVLLSERGRQLHKSA